LAETDVPSVTLGQKVVLTFDALPDLTLTGKVSEVDSSGTVSQGVVSYNATITPDTSNDSIKGGMTTTANIITKVVSDALVVPNAAVKTDTSGNKYVQILQSGKPVNQTVEVGISTDTYTQITSGLTEGQQVVTQTVNPNASTTTTARRGTGGGGAFPGGGTFPGGGVQIPGL
jgi:macrolide-specific efflux system membrane fusion protein